MTKALVVFFGLLLVIGFVFRDDVGRLANDLARGKSAGYSSPPSVMRGMNSFGNSLSGTFESFGKALK